MWGAVGSALNRLVEPQQRRWSGELVSIRSPIDHYSLGRREGMTSTRCIHPNQTLSGADLCDLNHRPLGPPAHV